MKITNDTTRFCANKMSATQAKYVDNTLKKAKSVDVICHNMTDRDSANSALVMWEYLNNLGINSRIIMSQKNVEMLGMRRTDCNIVQSDDIDEVNSIKPDISLCVDFGEKDRIPSQIYKHAKSSKKIMGFDHHSNINVVDSNFIRIKGQISEGQEIESACDYYTDSTAKSATSVIYRYFEALGRDITNNQAYDLMCGLVDDSSKRGVLTCNGEEGTITLKKEFKEDKNAYEIYKSLEEKLDKEQIAQIAKKIDVLSSLTPEQQKFREDLPNRMQFSPNRKIAYVEIKPNDEEWQNLGGDNVITSAIMNRFRRDTLKEHPETDIALVFYKAQDKYRLSAHSRKRNLLDFFSSVEKNNHIDCKQTYGGHHSRGGGSIKSLDEEKCHNWVTQIVNCDKFL